MQQKPPFFLVWNPNGGSPTFQHPTQESAEREAIRLGHASKGNEFFVLQPLTSVRVDGLTIRRFEPSDDIPL